MTNYKKDGEYLIIIDNILKNNEFKKMSDIKHHNTTRMDHSLKVSYYSYKIAKTLRLDYEDVARGGLLHDFYTDEIRKCNKMTDKILLFSTKHPNDAVINATNNFELSEKEINIIKSHMFPVDYRVPKYAESWIVSLVDKVLSFGEVSKRFSHRLGYLSNLYLLFILNIIK
mgnify:CR=1 FL=1